MSHGRALITRDSPAARDALDGAAVFVEAGDAAALASAIGRLRDDRAAGKRSLAMESTTALYQ